jgi:hypothetical protein
LRFYIEDKHEAGDLHTRIGNDIQLTVFRDGKVIKSLLIPHDAIHNGEYTFQKPEGTEGNVQFAAWGAHPDTPDLSRIYASVETGTKLEDMFLTRPPITRAATEWTELLPPVPHFRVVNAYVSDARTYIDVPLTPAICRIRVRIYTSRESDDLSALIEGTATQINLLGEGIGNNYPVHTPMQRRTNNPRHYDTGIVPTLPSRNDQTVSVVISDNGNEIIRLNEIDGQPITAKLGDYILFEYDEDNLSVNISINEWETENEPSQM